MIKYRIIQVNKSDHCIVVRYYTDLFTEDYFANFFNDDGSIQRTMDGYPIRCRTDFSLSLGHIPNPTKEQILEIVNNAAPREYFKTIEGVFANTYSLSNAESMIGIEGTVNADK